MSSPDDALTGFYARATGDAILAAIVPQVIEGFPADTLEASDLPRMTYFAAAPRTIAQGRYSVRLQVDGWFWPEPAAAAQRRSWTIRMLELFDEAVWTEGSPVRARLHSLVITPGRDLPAGPEEPMRRMIEILIDVSPA